MRSTNNTPRQASTDRPACSSTAKALQAKALKDQQKIAAVGVALSNTAAARQAVLKKIFDKLFPKNK